MPKPLTVSGGCANVRQNHGSEMKWTIIGARESESGL